MVDPFMKEEAIEVDKLEETNKKNEQAGAELCQAQVRLSLDCLKI